MKSGAISRVGELEIDVESWTARRWLEMFAWIVVDKVCKRELILLYIFCLSANLQNIDEYSFDLLTHIPFSHPRAV